MKYIGLIAVICIFQSIDFSNACNGHDVEITNYENGLDNIMKFENGAHFQFTKDCRVFAGVNATMERRVSSALECACAENKRIIENISYKLKTKYGDLLTVKNMNLCQLLSEFGISGTECPPLPGQVVAKMEGDIDFSSYGPILELFTGPVTVLIKICYDGDEIHPDVFAINAVIKKKNCV